MARVMHRGEWYEQLSSQALYESEYERILIEHSEDLFPDHYLVPFKRTVFSEDGSAQADLALIHKGYGEWFVVEAELSHHSLTHHVLPQVGTLSRARYGDAEVDYLAAKDSRLDVGKLRLMIRGRQPRVMVVVNTARHLWLAALEGKDCLRVVLEVFRSRHNQYVYRLNGDSVPSASVMESMCTCSLSRMLQLHSPGILPAEIDQPIEVTFGDGVTIWNRIDTADSVYLTTRMPVSVTPRKQYALVLRASGQYHLYEQ